MAEYRVGTTVLKSDGTKGKITEITPNGQIIITYADGKVFRYANERGLLLRLDEFYRIGGTVFGNMVDRKEIERELERQQAICKMENEKADAIRKRLFVYDTQIAKIERPEAEKRSISERITSIVADNVKRLGANFRSPIFKESEEVKGAFLVQEDGRTVLFHPKWNNYKSHRLFIAVSAACYVCNSDQNEKPVTYEDAYAYAVRAYQSKNGCEIDLDEVLPPYVDKEAVRRKI